MLEWLTKTYWLLPNFSWLGIAVILLILVICIICITAYRRRHKNKTLSESENEAPLNEVLESAAVAESEPVAEVIPEPTETEPTVEIIEEVEPAEEPEPVIEESEPQVEESHGFAEDANIIKDTIIVTNTDLSSKERMRRLIEEIIMEKKTNDNKVYHISKRKEDNRWQVKAAGASKAVKLFFTQAEAIEYAKSVAGNQEGRIVIHKEDGSFRKLSY